MKHLISSKSCLYFLSFFSQKHLRKSLNRNSGFWDAVGTTLNYTIEEYFPFKHFIAIPLLTLSRNTHSLQTLYEVNGN